MGWSRRSNDQIIKAALVGDLKSVENCICRGDDVSHGVDGMTPLLAATLGNHPHIVTVLCRAGAPLNQGTETGMTPLHFAAQYGYEEVCVQLLKHGAAVDPSIREDAHTPLCVAIARGHASIVRLLLEHGANARVKVNSGATTMHGACAAGQLDVAKLLLHYGVPVDSCDDSGKAPLYYAVDGWHRDVARWLVQNGAKLTPEATGMTRFQVEAARAQMG